MKRERLSAEGPAVSVFGLTVEEVQQQRAKGLINQAPSFTSRPVSAILLGNTLTLFNATLAFVVLLLLMVDQVRDAVLTGGLVAFTLAINTAQELQAKLRLDRIAVLARVRARVIREGREQEIDPDEVVLGDYLVLSRGEQAVVDGHLVLADGLEMDESLLTGEAEPARKSTGDLILSGSFCAAGLGVYLAERIGTASYVQRLTEEGRRYRNPQTPLQRLLNRVLRVLLAAVIGLSLLQTIAFHIQGVSLVEAVRATAVLVTLVPQGLLLTLTAAYSLGALRVSAFGALVQQLNAVESLSHVDLLCLDKTGTLTSGRLILREIAPAPGKKEDVARLVGIFAASSPQSTATIHTIAEALPAPICEVKSIVPFSSERQWSALAFAGPCPTGVFVLGAPEVLLAHAHAAEALSTAIAQRENAGQRVLLFAVAPTSETLVGEDGAPRLPHDLEPLCLVVLEEELRSDAQPALNELARQGITLKIISGDSHRTVLKLARRVGFPPETEAISGAELAALSAKQYAQTVNRVSVFGRVTPQHKREIVRALKNSGHYVAMIGDGANDVPALKEANLGIAMRNGSPALRGAADLVLLNDSFAILPSVLSTGRRIVNGIMLVLKLFLVRDVATIELIVISNFLGAPFPLLPPHAALIAFLTVGLPTLFVVVWAGQITLTPRTFRETAEFVLWVSGASALAILTVYILALVGFGASIGQARTDVVTTALLTGSTVLVLLNHRLDAPIRELLRDHLALALSGSMLVIYIGVLYLPVTQRYFELQPLGGVDWLVSLSSVSAWFTLLRIEARHRIIRRLLA